MSKEKDAKLQKMSAKEFWDTRIRSLDTERGERNDEVKSMDRKEESKKSVNSVLSR